MARPHGLVGDDGEVDHQHVGAAKAAERRRLGQLRAAITPAQRDALSEAARLRLAVLPELAAAQHVLGYRATRAEVDIDDVLAELLSRGVSVAVPWVIEDTPGRRGRLGLSLVSDLAADVAPGWRGVSEPRPDRRRPIRPEALDVVLAPGVGFDVDGNRLGHGGGHFDRLLARLRRGAVVIGVAFDEQITDRLPVEAHDRPVDVVVTPTRTLRPARTR